MKIMLLILSALFTLLTFAGSIYVLTHKGAVNAGYAVIPMVLALGCFGCYKTYKKK